MNKDESAKCLDISKKHWKTGNKEKAVKFAQKSLALDESVGAKVWLDTISNAQPKSFASGAEGASSTPAAQHQAREFTQEQVQAVQRIKSCAKDFYAVLSVEKSATDADLKKSYRKVTPTLVGFSYLKLALQFHPDKNSAPGASDAFKAIGNAYNVLSDPRKRQIYDSQGADGLERGGSSSSSSSGFTGGFSSSSRGGDFGSNDLSPEELFNLFFGGLASSGGRGGFQSASFSFGGDGQPRLRRGFRNNATSQEQYRRQQQPTASIIPRLFFQVLPLLFLLSGLFNTFIFRSEPSYSFYRNSKFSYPMATQHRKIDYFIQPSEYSTYFQGNTAVLRDFESKVESAFINNLQSDCQKEYKERQVRVNQLSWWGTQAELEKAQNLKLPSCERLQLRSGIELVVEAFEKKAASSQQELSHWKQVAGGQRQQIVTLESDITQLQRKLSEYEKSLSELMEDKKQAAASKNALMDKYNALRRNAMQLDTFRKQIVSMVEFSPNALNIPDADSSFADATIANAAALYNAASAIGINDIQLSGLSFNTDEFVKPTPSTSDNAPAAVNRKLRFAAAGDHSANLETLHLTPFKHEDPGLKDFSLDFSPKKMMASDNAIQRSASTGRKPKTEEEVGNQSVDASTLYRQIRSVLTHADFDKFATNVAEFNAGVQSAEVTIANISKLIKDPRLVEQMKGLIVKAIAETSQDFTRRPNTQTINAKSTEALAS